MREFEGLKLDMSWVTDVLLEEGVKAFEDSYDQLLADIDAKRLALKQTA